jgi:anti-sigma B factor antagonist
MDLLVDKTGDVTIAQVPFEELDASNVDRFKSEMAPLLKDTKKLVLDLSRLHFIDSSGLGAMLSCLRQLSAHGGDLKLSGMSKPVRATIELVRLHRILDIFNTKQEAVRAFG